jgi:hypothetical protein
MVKDVTCESCPIGSYSYCSGMKKRYGCGAEEQRIKVKKAARTGVYPLAL